MQPDGFPIGCASRLTFEVSAGTLTERSARFEIGYNGMIDHFGARYRLDLPQIKGL